MDLIVYLSGEIHTDWRDKIIQKCKNLNLPIEFLSPNTNHALSDDVGVKILGEENKKIWHDNKSAKINSIRNKNAIERADIVVVRFGEKYKQWNAAFDAGYASAMSKSLIIIHSDENQHALKEIDSVAQAVAKNVDEVIKILNYTCSSKI